MDSSLLVADKNMMEPVRIVIQLVIDGHDRPARITEYGVDTFGDQGIQKGL